MLAFLVSLLAATAFGQAFDGRFAGVKDVELGYRVYDNDRAEHAVVIVNGFTETYLMYDDLALPIVEAGFRVYTYDHRGQGVSDRLLPAIDVGYVEEFQDYIEDLRRFVEQVVKPRESLPLSLVAHSTGGLVAVHYAASHPDTFRRLVLSAPFFELNTRWVPTLIAKAIVSLSCAIGRCDRFAPTQGSFSPSSYAFEGNNLTHSKARFELMRTFIWENPALLIRGASSGFLRETIRAGEEVPELAPRVKADVLLFQAGADGYVLPGRQDVFCAATKCEKVRFDDAYHELFFEEEPTRSTVIGRTIDFLKRG